MKQQSLRVLAVGAAAAVGTAIVYFLDPVEGPSRRRAARAWVATTVRDLLGPPTQAAIPSAPEATVSEPELRLEPEPVLAPEEDRSEEPELEPIAEAVPAARYAAAAAAAPGQTFSTRLIPREPSDELVPDADADAVVAPAGDDAAAERPAMDVVWWRRGEHDLGEEPTSQRRPVLYLQGDPTPATRIVSYDDDGEPLPPLKRQKRRRTLPSRVLATGAAASAAAAFVLATWAVVLERDSEPSRAATPPRSAAERQAIALLTQPGARQIPVQGSRGVLVLVVGPRGEGFLSVSSIRPAPSGKAYEAWVIDEKGPTPAGVFSGAEKVIKLTVRIPKGATVAVTVERAQGAPAPTSKPVFAVKSS